MKRFRCTLLLHQRTLKRSYYSDSVIPGLNRKNNFQLQIEVPKDAPAISGYNYVMQRLANTTSTMTNRRITKVLHVFPESSYCLYLGEMKHLELTGLSAYSSKQKFYGQERYSKIERLVDNTACGKFGNNSFGFVGHMLPVFKKSGQSAGQDLVNLVSPSAIDIDDLVNVTSSQGGLVFGCPETLWDSLDLDLRLQEYMPDGPQYNTAKFAAKYSIVLGVDDLAEIKPEDLNATHENGILAYPARIEPDPLNEGLRSIRYTIGVIRKR